MQVPIYMLLLTITCLHHKAALATKTVVNPFVWVYNIDGLNLKQQQAYQ